jgi:competence protein ComEA
MRMSTLVGFATFVFALLGAAPAVRAEAPAPAPALTAAASPVGDGTVNLNTATVAELVRLPGVGPAKAAAIAAFRVKHGPFRRIDDLDRVKGFGRRLIAKVRHHVALDGPTTFVGKPRSRKELAPSQPELE